MRNFRIFSPRRLSVELSRVIKSFTLFDQRFHFAMSAKFYFYFFWYLRPLADREGC
ncbi:MAG: hypothetical protein PCALPYG08_3360 [uncultured Paraburkholderia sp.]|nr:MAG: hypothetical protein PCALPYG08_3360 [uncultured Paraburkholderia sp.]